MGISDFNLSYSGPVSLIVVQPAFIQATERRASEYPDFSRFKEWGGDEYVAKAGQTADYLYANFSQMFPPKDITDVVLASASELSPSKKHPDIEVKFVQSAFSALVHLSGRTNPTLMSEGLMLARRMLSADPLAPGHLSYRGAVINHLDDPKVDLPYISFEMFTPIARSYADLYVGLAGRMGVFAVPEMAVLMNGVFTFVNSVVTQMSSKTGTMHSPYVIAVKTFFDAILTRLDSGRVSETGIERLKQQLGL